MTPNQASQDFPRDLGDDGVAECCNSVNLAGYPMSHSTKSGLRLPSFFEGLTALPNKLFVFTFPD